MSIWKTLNCEIGRMASTTRETQMMGDASDLRHHFNTLMNNTSCLTNSIKLLSQQI